MSPVAVALNSNATYDRLTRATSPFRIQASQRRLLASPDDGQPIASSISADRICEGSDGDRMHKLIIVRSGYLDIEGCLGGWIVLPGHMILIPAERQFNIIAERYTSLDIIHLSPSMTPWRHHGCWVARATLLAREMISYAVTLSHESSSERVNANEAEDSARERIHKFNLYIASLSFLCPDWFVNARMLFLPSAQSDETSRLLEYLRNHIATAHVEDAAKQVGLPQRSLHRHCMMQFGMNLRSLIREIRLVLAMEFLSSTDWPIGIIARKVGFSSLSAFTTAFSHRLQMTPRQYLSEYRS